MEQSIRSWGVDRFDEGEATMKAEPFSGVTAPLDVEAIVADPVEAGERGVELFVEILREGRSGTLNEPIFGAVPLSQDIDGIIELGRPDEGPVPFPTAAFSGRIRCSRGRHRYHDRASPRSDSFS
jgi:hypothetical protein